MFEILQNETNITNIVIACYVAVGTGNNVHKNRPCHGFALHCSGKKKYVFSDGNTITVEKNSIIYLPKNSSYTVETLEPGDCYAINFQIDSLEYYEPFVINVKNAESFLEIFKTAENTWNSKSTGYMLKCKSLLYNSVYLLHIELNKKYINKRKSEIINSAVLYIHNNYQNFEISITKLAEMCNITPEYFRKIFKSIYGISPIKYINNLKLEHAKELLLSGQYTVTEAMFLAGYDDPSYFSHTFKKKYSVSPSNIK